MIGDRWLAILESGNLRWFKEREVLHLVVIVNLRQRIELENLKKEKS